MVFISTRVRYGSGNSSIQVFFPQYLQNLAFSPSGPPQWGQIPACGFSFTTNALLHTMQNPRTIGAPHRGQIGMTRCWVVSMGTPHDVQNFTPPLTGFPQEWQVVLSSVGVAAPGSPVPFVGESFSDSFVISPFFTVIAVSFFSISFSLLLT